VLMVQLFHHLCFFQEVDHGVLSVRLADPLARQTY
jgi:hypothetical protein